MEGEHREYNRREITKQKRRGAIRDEVIDYEESHLPFFVINGDSLEMANK